MLRYPNFQTAQELGEQLLSLAHKTHDQLLLADAHFTLGFTLFFRGELVSARDHLQQGIALHALPQGRSRAVLYGLDPGVPCRSVMAYALWLLGYPDQALKSSEEARALAQELSHPYSSAIARYFATAAYLCRGEGRERAQERAEALIGLCSEQGFTLFLGWGTIVRGWALAERGEGEEGIVQIRQGMDACRTTGGEVMTAILVYLASRGLRERRTDPRGPAILAEALAVSEQN